VYDPKMAPKRGKTSAVITPETIADWKRAFKNKTDGWYRHNNYVQASSDCLCIVIVIVRRVRRAGPIKEWAHQFNSSCICIQWESSSFRRIIIESNEARDSSHDHWKRSIWLDLFRQTLAWWAHVLPQGNRFLPFLLK
jgi:hypothetical protein